MEAIAVTAAALAMAAFCVMHVVKSILGYLRERDRRAEREKVRKELDDEVLKGGNLTRISELRERMRKLDA